jgi:pimeloyl-ACP methyl ester carboxylesterase
LLYSFGPRFQAIAVSRRLFPNPGQEQLRAIFLEEILQADPAGYRAAFAALARFNLTSCLSRVKTPVLVITGECDTTIPPVIQRQLADQIPGSRHIVIPGAGHAVTVEQPEAFNKAMLEFL